MSDFLLLIWKWLAIAAAASPILVAVCWTLWADVFLPRFIPSAEIEGIAEQVMRDHANDPEEWALMEEYAAWHRSRSFEQGKWRLVRKAINRRLRAGDGLSAG